MAKAVKQTKKETKVSAEENMVAAKEETNSDKIGGMLKDARLKKELDLVDIARILNIRRVHLEAIEESDYAEVPDFPYGPGFVRTYANYLGLNGDRIVQLFKEETDRFKGIHKRYAVLEPQSEVVAPNRRYLLISLLSILAVYLVWFFFKGISIEKEAQLDEDEVVETEASVEQAAFPLTVEDFATINNSNAVPAEGLTVIDTTAAPVTDDSEQVIVNEGSFVEQTAPATEEQPAVAPDASAPATDTVPTIAPTTPALAAPEEAAEVSSTVILKVKDEAWVEVKDKDKLYLSKVLKPGETYTVPNGGVGITLSVGRLNAVDIYINDKLTPVVTANKKTNISLDSFLNH